MADKEIYDWIKRALDHITGFIEAVDKRQDALVETVKKCREHCDHCREVCSLKDDHERRLRSLEGMRDSMHGACEAKKGIWYRSFHFWHSLAAWAAIAYAVYLKTGGIIH